MNKLKKNPFAGESGQLRVDKLIKSFVKVGDVIEVEYQGTNKIYEVERFQVCTNMFDNRGEHPTEFIIHVKFRDNLGSIECTSDRFKYIRHISHSLI